jgi:hypothetical protein
MCAAPRRKDDSEEVSIVSVIDEPKKGKDDLNCLIF